MHGPPPTATYRFQLTPTFGFDRAAAQLAAAAARLGISHVYLSPVTEAVPGSTHGYDVVDHAPVRDELGGLDGLTALLDALRRARHGRRSSTTCRTTPPSARPELNPRWWAMLRDGPDSEAARWFDVDWAAADGKVILPVLGDAARRRRRPTSRSSAASCASGRSASRWRRAPSRCRRRRRSTASTTACSGGATRPATSGGSSRSTTSSACASRTPTSPPSSTPCRGCSPTTPAFAGVRVDHVDGLADPLAYLDGLREAIGDRWLLVEKILAAGETLPRAWPVDGTTGYEHATVLEHALLDRRRVGRSSRDRLGRGRPGTADRSGRGSSRPAGRCCDGRAAARTSSASARCGGRARRAGRRRPARRRRDAQRAPRALPHVPARRGGPPGARGRRRRRPLEDRPELAAPIERLAAALDEPGEWRDPLAAADRAGDGEGRRGPGVLALRAAGVARRGRRARRARAGDATPSPSLHAHHAGTADVVAATLLAGTTHDVARSEDVRAAGLALAARAPGAGTPLVDAWRAGPGAVVDVDPAMQWLALQTVAHDARPRRRPAARVPRQGGAGGRPAHVVDGRPPSRTRRRSAGSPASLAHVGAGPSTWPPRCDRPGRRDRRWRCSPCASPRPASPTCTRAPRRSAICSSTPTTGPSPTTPRSTRSSTRAAATGRPGGVGRGRLAGGAGGGAGPAAAARRRSTDGYAALGRARRACWRSPAPTSTATPRARDDRARAGARGPGARRRPAARARGATSSSTTCRTPTARSPSTPPSTPSRRSSSSAALTSSTGAGTVDDDRAPDRRARPTAAVGVPRRRVEGATVEPGGVDAATVAGPSPNAEHDHRARVAVAPALDDDRCRRATVDGLLGVAAQHAVAAAQRRAARCRRRAPAVRLGRRRATGRARRRRTSPGRRGRRPPRSTRRGTRAGGPRGSPPAAPRRRGRRRTGTAPARRTPRP